MLKGRQPLKNSEKAGAFENLKFEMKRTKGRRRTFWKQKENIKVYISALFVVSWFLGRAVW